MIIFESHATSEDNEKGFASGWHDAPLSEKGKEQARELGKRYQDTHLIAVYVSDLSRSYETARIAFASHAAPILKDSRLREWNYGKFNRFPDNHVETLKSSYVNTPFPEGESLQDAINRFLSFHQELPQDPQGTILIIGHSATYYALEHHFHKTPLTTLVTKPWQWQPGWHYTKF